MRDNNHGKKGPFAKAAKDYLAQLIHKKQARLEMGIQKTGRYGRTLAYVYLDDTAFVNAEMVKAGLTAIETISQYKIRRLLLPTAVEGKGGWLWHVVQKGLHTLKKTSKRVCLTPCFNKKGCH